MVSSVVALQTSLETLLSVALNHLCDVELACQIVTVMSQVTAQKIVLQTMIVLVVKPVLRGNVEQNAVDPVHVHRVNCVREVCVWQDAVHIMTVQMTRRV